MQQILVHLLQEQHQVQQQQLLLLLLLQEKLTTPFPQRLHLLLLQSVLLQHPVGLLLATDAKQAPDALAALEQLLLLAVLAADQQQQRQQKQPGSVLLKYLLATRPFAAFVLLWGLWLAPCCKRTRAATTQRQLQ